MTISFFPKKTKHKKYLTRCRWSVGRCVVEKVHKNARAFCGSKSNVRALDLRRIILAHASACKPSLFILTEGEVTNNHSRSIFTKHLNLHGGFTHIKRCYVTLVYMSFECFIVDRTGRLLLLWLVGGVT